MSTTAESASRPVDGPGPTEVAVLLVSLPTAVWGAQRRLLELAPELGHRGVHLTLAGRPDSEFAVSWRDAGLPLEPLDLAMHKGLRRRDGTGRRAGASQLAAEAATTLRAVRRILPLARRSDVVLSTDLSAFPETVIAGRLARRPVVLEVVDLVEPGIGRRLLRLTGRRATVCVANSSATAAMFDGTGARVELIHPGVDLGRYRPGPVDPAVRASLCDDPAAPLVGIVGRIDPKKGHHVLIEAMARLGGAAAAAQLVVVGAPGTSPLAHDYATDMSALAASLVGRRARFVGRRDDVPAVLRSLDVLVNASDAEPFGLSVLEAQASGIPPVATASGGIPDFVEDGRTGLLVAPDDVDGLAAAISRLVADPALGRRLGEAGRRQAEERLGLDDQFDHMATLYRSLARC